MKLLMGGLITLVSLGSSLAQSGTVLFREKETSIFAFGSYVDKPDSDLAPGVGFSYFFSPNIGISASTYWENFDGSFIDNVAAEGIFRWPLRRMPLAPYALAGVGYSFESEDTNFYFGGGAEYRFQRKMGLFGDVRWQINDETRDGVGVRVGVRWVF
jgi:hypothetical protein